MVAMLEIAFLIVCAALGLRWFRRTSLYKAHRRSGAWPGQMSAQSSERADWMTGFDQHAAAHPERHRAEQDDK